MLAFVIVTAYFEFSQYLIIWAGNLPFEISWYLRRSQPGWLQLGLAAFALHCVAPFVLLLSREVKRSPARLANAAALVAVSFLAMVDWIIAPAFSPASVWLHFASVASIVAIGGVWVAAFNWQAAARLREFASLPGD